MLKQQSSQVASLVVCVIGCVYKVVQLGTIVQPVGTSHALENSSQTPVVGSTAGVITCRQSLGVGAGVGVGRTLPPLALAVLIVNPTNTKVMVINKNKYLI